MMVESLQNAGTELTQSLAKVSTELDHQKTEFEAELAALTQVKEALNSNHASLAKELEAKNRQLSAKVLELENLAGNGK